MAQSVKDFHTKTSEGSPKGRLVLLFASLAFYLVVAETLSIMI